MSRKGTRIRLVTGRSQSESQAKDSGKIMSLKLGQRLAVTEQSEIWTIRGTLADHKTTDEDVGELSFVLMPGLDSPATSVVGYIAPDDRYTLAIDDNTIWANVRSMLVQLGYDQDGFAVSIGVGGTLLYREEQVDLDDDDE